MNDRNAFLGKPDQPTGYEGATVLGSATPAWNQLLEWLKEEEKLREREWNPFSLKYGWTLRVECKKRNIVYMASCKRRFQVSFILGVAAARASKLPKPVQKALDETPEYPEGTGLRLIASKSEDPPAIGSLTRVKLAN